MSADETLKHITISGKWSLVYNKNNLDPKDGPYYYQINDNFNTYVPVELVDSVLQRETDEHGRIIRNDLIEQKVWDKAEQLMKEGF